MRLFVLFLFIGTATLIVGDQVEKVLFPANVLEYDLDAIEKYHAKFPTEMDAHILWPYDIVFEVQKKEDCLKINGEFKQKTFLGSSKTSYNGLYYKQGTFFFVDTKTLKHHEIPKSSLVTYKLNENKIQKVSYLSIQYKSVEEVKNEIAPHYTRSPGDQSSRGGAFNLHFIEFLPTSEEIPSYAGGGGLLILTGKIERKKLRVDRNSQTAGLVYDQAGNKVLVPVDTDSVGPPYVPNVFGVRMESRGFMEEVQGENKKALSKYDLTIHQQSNTTS